MKADDLAAANKGGSLMGQIVVSADIPAPPEKVWSYCKDIESTPDWFPAIHSVRAVSESREGVGAEFEFTAKTQLEL